MGATLDRDPARPTAAPHAAAAASLATAGFDLIAPVAIDAADAPLPTFGRAAALGLVVGNTRALWPRLLAALAADPVLAADPDPVDRYTERTHAAHAPPGTAPFFAHLRTLDGRPPIQRLPRPAALASPAQTRLA